MNNTTEKNEINEAIGRVESFLRMRSTMGSLHKNIIHCVNGIDLEVRDLQILLAALSRPSAIRAQAMEEAAQKVIARNRDYATADAIRSLKTAAPQPSPEAAHGIDVDQLAQFIRQIDGNNSMGAGALAERICEWLEAQPEASSDKAVQSSSEANEEGPLRQARLLLKHGKMKDDILAKETVARIDAALLQSAAPAMPEEKEARQPTIEQIAKHIESIGTELFWGERRWAAASRTAVANAVRRAFPVASAAPAQTVAKPSVETCDIPEGYALVSKEALRVWGKYDEVSDACIYVTGPTFPSAAKQEGEQ